MEEVGKTNNREFYHWLVAVAGPYGAKFHGDSVDGHGNYFVDVEFPTVRHAADFVAIMTDGDSTAFHVGRYELRDPVTNFTSPVTVIVKRL